MLAQLLSGAVLGIDAIIVTVEVDTARGLPAMTVVGLAESAVREGRERVHAALSNSGFALRMRRTTVGLAPADVRKDGSAFDLPIALGLLAASGLVPARRLAGHCFVGELGLDGELRPVRGVLPIAEQCAREEIRTLVVPHGNGPEAAAAGCVEVRPARTLGDVVAYLRGAAPLPALANDATVTFAAARAHGGADLSDVRGQLHARRALEIAAAGMHNLLLVGPPGAGKSMLARRLPGILPPLARAEAVEVTKVHSVAGRLRTGESLVTVRPFRAPHHTISDAGLIGGGALPRPGEASLAHHGVLFLDELPEFRRHVLDALRQPLEDGEVHIGRARFGVRFPARFMLVAAMNPCPCGFHGTGSARCVCNPAQIARYLGRVSGPLLDRIDIHIDVAPVGRNDLLGAAEGERSAAVRTRVERARVLQQERLHALRLEHGSVTDWPDVFANAHLPPALVRRCCELNDAGTRLIRAALQRLGLSARALHRVLRVARTIADLAGEDRILVSHVAEAVQYRTLDRVRMPYALAKTRR